MTPEQQTLLEEIVPDRMQSIFGFEDGELVSEQDMVYVVCMGYKTGQRVTEFFAEDTVTALLDALADARKDAERYRFERAEKLRNRKRWCAKAGYIFDESEEVQMLDEAIDQAMKGGES